jgi:hypothetical protein
MASNPIEIRDGGSEQQALRPAGISSASLAAFSGKSMLGLDQAPSQAALSNLPGLDLFDSQLSGTATNTGEFPNGSLSNFTPSEGTTFSASQLGNDVQSLTNLFSPQEQLQAGSSDLSSLLNNGNTQLGNFLEGSTNDLSSLLNNGTNELSSVLNNGTSQFGNFLNGSTNELSGLLSNGPSDLGSVLNDGTNTLTGLLNSGTSQLTGALGGTMSDLPTPPSPTQLTGLLQVGLTNPIEGLEDTLKSIF